MSCSNSKEYRKLIRGMETFTRMFDAFWISEDLAITVVCFFVDAWTGYYAQQKQNFSKTIQIFRESWVNNRLFCYIISEIIWWMLFIILIHKLVVDFGKKRFIFVIIYLIISTIFTKIIKIFNYIYINSQIFNTYMKSENK